MPDAAAPTIDLLIGRSLLSAEVIAQELRERLADALADRKLQPDRLDDLVELARAVLSDFEPILAENLLAADLAAWLAGYDQLASQLPPWAMAELGAGRFGGPPPPKLPGFLDFPGSPEELRFPLLEEAAASLMDRGILTREEFDRQNDASKSRSFTITGDLSRDTIETIRDALAEDVREGTSLRGFRERVEEAIGASPIGPAHIENVYRTNVQAAFRDGRETLADNPIVSEVFPYQAYHAVHDGRTRPEHLALERLGLDGTNVYRRDDPFWDQWTPPNGYNCRCGVTLVTIDGAARAGVREAQEWLRTGDKPPLEPRRIPFDNEPGFGQRSGRQAVAMSAEAGCVSCGYVLRMAAEDWQAYRGPRGGKGWKNAKTGRVAYQEDRPGGNEVAEGEHEKAALQKVQQASAFLVKAQQGGLTSKQAAAYKGHATRRLNQARDILRRGGMSEEQIAKLLDGLTPQKAAKVVQRTASQTKPKQHATLRERIIDYASHHPQLVAKRAAILKIQEDYFRVLNERDRLDRQKGAALEKWQKTGKEKDRQAHEELVTAHRALADEAKKQRVSLNEKAHAALALPKDQQATFDVRQASIKPLTKDHLETAVKGVSFVRKISRTVGSPIVVHLFPLAPGVRAHWKNGYVNTAPEDDIETHVHELGHHLENSLPGAREAAQIFRNYRVQKSGKPDVNLKAMFPNSNYYDYEVGNEDDVDGI